jgi:gliding motility-associatede transport system auxiliary component
MRERLEAWADYFGGVGLAFLAVSVLLFLLNQPRERSVVLLAISVVLLVLYVIARPQQVRETVTGRGVRYGSNALLLAIAFIGLIALLNFLSGRYNGRYDLTQNKSQSLSDLTIKALQDLKEPVRVTAFYTTLNADPQGRQDALDRLKEYSRYSDKFTYRFIDPQSDPQIANDYKVQFDATIVFERGTRRENALNSDEQTLTNTLLKVSQDKQSIVYFTTGHGEHGIDDTGENGYSGIKTPLEAFNFKFDSLNFQTITSTLPSDITALVIAGPKEKFTPDEAQRVKDYLDKNGRVLLLADPQTDTGLDSVLTSWGLALRNDVVFDSSSSISGRPQLLIIQAYKSHVTTQDLAGFALFLPNSRSLSTSGQPISGRTTTALFSSSANSWGETSFDSVKNQNAQFDSNADVKGPLDLAYAGEATGTNPARLVVIGNSTFLTNGTFRVIQGQIANVQFAVGLMNWLAGQENLIAIPPKPPASNPMILTADSGRFVFLSSFVMLPGAILLIGALIWWRRR